MKGCLLAPFTFLAFLWHSLWKGVFWCFENGMKGFIAGGVVVIIIGVILGQSCNGGGAKGKISDITTTGIGIPTKIEAPYYISVTNGDDFYTQSYHWQGNLLILENYWYLKDGKWLKGPADAISGTIKVVTR